MIDRQHPATRGFTLVEMIVVVVLMGLVTAAISFAALTILRIAPRAGDRTDHANAQSSLLSWLSRDLAGVPAHDYTTTGGVAIATAVCPSGPGSPLLGLGSAIDTGSGVEAAGVDYRLVTPGRMPRSCE